MTTTKTSAPSATQTPGLDLDATAAAVPAVVTKAEVVAAQPSAIAAALTGPSALDDFDDLDLSPEESAVPFLKINRKVGQDDSGIAIDGGHVLSATFVWAARSTSRAHFPTTFDQDPQSRPDCWSSDGVAPSPTATNRKAETCAGCPWSFEATGGKAATPDATPGCTKNLEAMIYMEDGDQGVRVARLRFGGIAYKAARDYWEAFRFSRPRLRSVQFLTRMDLESVKTDNGNFLSPVFVRAERLPDEQAIAIATDARDMLGSFAALVSDDIVEGATRDPNPGPFDGPPTATGVSSDGEIIDNRPRPGGDRATPQQDWAGVGYDETEPF